MTFLVTCGHLKLRNNFSCIVRLLRQSAEHMTVSVRCVGVEHSKVQTWHTEMEEFSSLPPFSSPSNEDYLVDVSGKMDSIPSISKPVNGEGKPEFNTLDEPIRLTIVRDLKAVGNKFLHVLYPRHQTSLLTEWDLWGPLILCTFMALLLQGRSGSTDHDGGPEFAEVFVIVWVGAMAVTINTKLLGGTISFFQSVCVLGYCLLPLSIALALCRVVLLLQQNTIFFILRCGFSLTAFLWAVWAAMKFLGDSSPPRRKVLAAYPIGLFYFVIAWLVVSLSNS